MSDLIRYRRLCQTEGAYVYSDFRPEEDGPPSACPTNTGHTLSPTDEWTEVERHANTIPLDSVGRARVAQEVHTFGYRKSFQPVDFVVPVNCPVDGTGAIYEVKFTFPFEIISGDVWIEPTAQKGDKLQIDIIDIDNILGLGANTILASFGQIIPTPGERYNVTDADRTALLPVGVYVRVTYLPKTAININTVRVLGHLIGYKPTP